jgi:hypothetical protein
MKINFAGILTLFILTSFCACAGKKEVTTHNSSQTKTTQAQESGLNIAYMQMRRTACFGRCPEYFIEIYKDGLVRYTGIRNVTDTGIYEKKMDPAVITSLLNKFQEFHVDTCKERYDMIISDLPGINYKFTFDNEITKQIHNAHFGPEALKVFAKDIDQTIIVDRSWKQISTNWKQD